MQKKQNICTLNCTGLALTVISVELADQLLNLTHIQHVKGNITQFAEKCHISLNSAELI